MGKMTVAKIRVKVNPGASRTQILGVEDGVYRVRVAAPPVKGKANKELVRYLATLFKVRKGDIEISSGEHARTKAITIKGIQTKEVTEILNNV